jgi:peptide-methionine (S)-S-oxide reductase
MKSHMLAALAVTFLSLSGVAWAGELNRPLPAPLIDPANNARTETAVLAGGCFWGQQAIFEHVKGVSRVIEGYTGGSRATATYEQVSAEDTGHAEAVEIRFDPRKVSYGTLLRIFFSVAHDPLQADGQGPDIGSSYRPAIFPTTPTQATTAAAYLAQLEAAHIFDGPIATKLEPFKGFFRAEEYHQDYLIHHPENLHIRQVEMPKLRAMKAVWPQYYRAAPALAPRYLGP